MPFVVKLVAPVPPLATVNALDNVKPAKVGLALLAMSWTVLIVPLPLSLKLVALNVAIPLVEASALALLMVTMPPAPEALAIVTAPV